MGFPPLLGEANENIFTMAIRDKNKSLQGLSYGYSTTGKNVRLEAIEAKGPDLCTLKGQVFPINHWFLEVYASLLGIS